MKKFICSVLATVMFFGGYVAIPQAFDPVQNTTVYAATSTNYKGAYYCDRNFTIEQKMPVKLDNHQVYWLFTFKKGNVYEVDQYGYYHEPCFKNTTLYKYVKTSVKNAIGSGAFTLRYRT